MDYNSFALKALYMFPPLFNVPMVPYIASQGIMKGRIRAISRYMEGQESYESDPSQGTVQKDLDYAHIPMYATIGVKPTYVRGYRGKSRV